MDSGLAAIATAWRAKDIKLETRPRRPEQSHNHRVLSLFFPDSLAFDSLWTAEVKPSVDEISVPLGLI
jgi:hypothetical protein